jgi:hypothetical protein
MEIVGVVSEVFGINQEEILERSPNGKTDFKFYVVCETEEVDFEK